MVGVLKNPEPKVDPPPPTIVNATVSFDCSTIQDPSGEALLSDGTFEHLKLYKAGSGVSSSTITCADEEIVFDIVDCNGTPAGFFCLPANFACNYFTPNGTSTQELCSPQ